jgi:hypothetical protein
MESKIYQQGLYPKCSRCIEGREDGRSRTSFSVSVADRNPEADSESDEGGLGFDPAMLKDHFIDL